MYISDNPTLVNLDTPVVRIFSMFPKFYMPKPTTYSEFVERGPLLYPDFS